MYYQEKIIDGILCFKLSPNDDWKPVGEKELTKRVEELQIKVALLELELEERTQLK